MILCHRGINGLDFEGHFVLFCFWSRLLRRSAEGLLLLSGDDSISTFGALLTLAFCLMGFLSINSFREDPFPSKPGVIFLPRLLPLSLYAPSFYFLLNLSSITLILLTFPLQHLPRWDAPPPRPLLPHLPILFLLPAFFPIPSSSFPGLLLPLLLPFTPRASSCRYMSCYISLNLNEVTSHFLPFSLAFLSLSFSSLSPRIMHIFLLFLLFLGFPRVFVVFK